jgi:tight adherence protein C
MAANLVPPSLAIFIALPFGALLILGGLLLLLYSARMRSQALAMRVDLILPKPGTRNGAAAVPAESSLLRQTSDGLADREQRELVRQLAKIGVARRHAPAVLLGARLLTALAMVLLVLFGGGHRFGLGASSPLLPTLIAGSAGFIGWLLPLFVLRHLVGQHAARVAAGLPDALELLVICVEAGLSLEDGIDRIVPEIRRSQEALGEDLAMTAADLKILPSRDQALANFASRIDLPAVRSVVTTLSQTMRYGTPLAQALRAVAADMRNEALMQLEERASQLPSLLTVPMMLFIMPTIFLIVGGPAALRLIDIFTK